MFLSSLFLAMEIRAGASLASLLVGVLHRAKWSLNVSLRMNLVHWRHQVLPFLGSPFLTTNTATVVFSGPVVIAHCFANIQFSWRRLPRMGRLHFTQLSPSHGSNKFSVLVISRWAFLRCYVFCTCLSALSHNKQWYWVLFLLFAAIFYNTRFKFPANQQEQEDARSVLKDTDRGVRRHRESEDKGCQNTWGR